jgi:DNA (cytosine-5)-methyltransferase 1
LLNLQSFPQNYQFPTNYSLTKIASLLGNSLNLAAVKHFLQDKNFSDLNFVDLFAGLGGFHLAVKELTNKCVLVVDKNKNCQEVYQLNFPTAPFLLGDINNKEIQKKIIATDFDLLCAGFPCQSYSRARKKQGVSLELTSLLPIIRKKKPRYLLLENVPNFLTNSESSKFLSSLLVNYQLHLALINPKQLGVKQKRPRIFI